MLIYSYILRGVNINQFKLCEDEKKYWGKYFMPIFYKEYLIARERDAKIEEAKRRILEFLEKNHKVDLSELELVLLHHGDMDRWIIYEVLDELEEKGEINRETIFEVSGLTIKLVKDTITLPNCKEYEFNAELFGGENPK